LLSVSLSALGTGHLVYKYDLSESSSLDVTF
jgi:hypothetical protein